MEDFYEHVLTPRLQETLAVVGLGFVSLRWEVVRAVIICLEIIAAALLLFNRRKLASLLAILIIASGSKNIAAKMIHVEGFGEVEVFPIAFVQGLMAVLILLLPSGSPRRPSEKKYL